MAMNSRASTELLIPRKWQETEINSPERTRIWSENSKSRSGNRACVVYYICRNGQVEQPHFMEFPLTCPEGLYLRDVMNRLNSLRGEGMASMYSWSSKRSYRNGFVWQDLSENDLIQPTRPREYVLKGSELLRSSLSCRYTGKTGSLETESPFPGQGPNFPATIRQRTQSWSSLDKSGEYIVYKSDSSGEVAGKSSDAATQTGDESRIRRSVRETRTELSREQTETETETSTPFSNSSSEVLLGVRGSGAVNQARNVMVPTAKNEHPSGRMKASCVLKHLMACGSISVKDCESEFGGAPRKSVV